MHIAAALQLVLPRPRPLCLFGPGLLLKSTCAAGPASFYLLPVPSLTTQFVGPSARRKSQALRSKLIQAYFKMPAAKRETKSSLVRTHGTPGPWLPPSPTCSQPPRNPTSSRATVTANPRWISESVRCKGALPLSPQPCPHSSHCRLASPRALTDFSPSPSSGSRSHASPF